MGSIWRFIFASVIRAKAHTVRSILAAAILIVSPATVVCAETGETDPENPVYAVAYAGRIAGDATATRVFVDFDRKLDLDHFFMDNPGRMVIEGPAVLFRFADVRGLAAAGLVKSARYGTMSADRSRIVLTLSGPVAVTRFETVEIEADRKYRLVVDLAAATPEEFAKAVAEQERNHARNGEAEARNDLARPPAGAKGRFTIVIDPGHGGIDTGATGATGVSEKELTLAFALQLRDAISMESLFEVKLTREEDIFLALNERIAFSRRNRADLTIAVHADSVRQNFVRGATVYTLSRTASDGLAAELAHSENLSDIVAGLEFDSRDDAVGDILADLTARETSAFSRQFAGTVIEQLGGKVALIKNPRRSAAFRVLKTAEVPAILLELGYLSNAEDEKLMTDPVWQKMIANEVATAVRRFFEGRIPD